VYKLTYSLSHAWNLLAENAYAEIDIYSHLQTLSKDVFIRADYAFSALATISFRLMGYTSVLSNSNSAGKATFSV